MNRLCALIIQAGEGHIRYWSNVNTGFYQVRWNKVIALDISYLWGVNFCFVQLNTCLPHFTPSAIKIGQETKAMFNIYCERDRTFVTLLIHNWHVSRLQYLQSNSTALVTAKLYAGKPQALQNCTISMWPKNVNNSWPHFAKLQQKFTSSSSFLFFFFLLICMWLNFASDKLIFCK